MERKGFQASTFFKKSEAFRHSVRAKIEALRISPLRDLVQAKSHSAFILTPELPRWRGILRPPCVAFANFAQETGMRHAHRLSAVSRKAC